MKPSAARRPPPAAASWLLLFALVFAAGASAQLTNDPTRPPPGYDTAPAASSETEGAGAMTLQSVMISPTRKAAIISGVMVSLGEKYGDAVLVKVAENEVVLRSGNENQVLKLHPGVEKRDSAAAARGARRDKAKNAPSVPPR
jgi:MSHA biogenesis protein MshK